MQTTILLSPVFNSNSQREVKLNTKGLAGAHSRYGNSSLHSQFILEITALIRASYDVGKLLWSELEQPVKIIDYYCLFY